MSDVTTTDLLGVLGSIVVFSIVLERLMEIVWMFLELVWQEYHTKDFTPEGNLIDPISSRRWMRFKMFFSIGFSLILSLTITLQPGVNFLEAFGISDYSQKASVGVGAAFLAPYMHKILGVISAWRDALLTHASKESFGVFHPHPPAHAGHNTGDHPKSGKEEDGHHVEMHHGPEHDKFYAQLEALVRRHAAVVDHARASAALF